MSSNLKDLDPLTQSPPTPTFHLARRALSLAIILALLWLTFLIDSLFFHGDLTQYGITPRTTSGLLGILFAPFLHASFSHLLNNSIAILLLGGILILRSEAAFWITSILGLLATGLGTWIIGRSNSVHVGASGIIFAYFGFLLSAGIFERRFFSILLSLAVFFLWGGLLWSTLPQFASSHPISWEGHLTGLAGGILTAKLLARPRTNPAPPASL